MIGPITFITIDEAKLIIKHMHLYGETNKADWDTIFNMKQRLILEIAKNEKRQILRQLKGGGGSHG